MKEPKVKVFVSVELREKLKSLRQHTTTPKGARMLEPISDVIERLIGENR